MEPTRLLTRSPEGPPAVHLPFWKYYLRWVGYLSVPIAAIGATTLLKATPSDLSKLEFAALLTATCLLLPLVYAIPARLVSRWAYRRGGWVGEMLSRGTEIDEP